MKDPTRMKFIAKCISRVTKFEQQKFCSDSFSSILIRNNVDVLRNFQWNSVLKEAEDTMPVLLEVLNSCTETPTERRNTGAIIGLIISILTKHRQPHACLSQKVISLILYSGHCSKKVDL